MRKAVIWTGCVMLLFWGAAHIANTGGVLKGFGYLTAGNANVLAMEWINEGVTLIFLGLLAGITAIVEGKGKAAVFVYVAVFAMLAALSAVSLFTGFKVNFLPYKLCALIFLASGLLILTGGVLLKK